MKISDIKINRIDKDNSRLKAIAVITFDNVFVVRDIRVIDGDNGIFIAMPSFQLANGNFRDLCHPISREFQDELQEAIVEEYNRVVM